MAINGIQTTIRPKEDQNFWNFVFSVFFFVVVVGAILALWKIRAFYPTVVTPFDAVLMVLAAFRMTRLVVYDKVSRFFREWFLDSREIEQDGKTVIELTVPEAGMRRTLHDLVDCPWCIGMWSALIITLSYFIFPWAWFVILFLAVAGASSFIQVAANALGWDAENLKREAQGKVR